MELWKTQNRRSLNIKRVVSWHKAFYCSIATDSLGLNSFKPQETPTGKREEEMNEKEVRKTVLLFVGGGETKIPRFELPQEFKYTNHNVILHTR